MSIENNPRKIDLKDIQGMVTRGYGKLYQTAYYFISVADSAKAKTWIKDFVLPKVSDAVPLSTSGTKEQAQLTETLHLSVTATGLLALGLSETNLANFPIPFREGMDQTHRNRQLGDYGPNAPSDWDWGGQPQRDQLHLLLIMHAFDEKTLTDLLKEVDESLADGKGGVKVFYQSRGFQRKDGREPFGFHDGISQPVIEGSGRSGPKNDIVKTGEFLMGYKNEYDEWAYSPWISDLQGDVNLLADSKSQPGFKDLGKNGSFMVYRQIQQHTDRFWKYMGAQGEQAEIAKRKGQNENPELTKEEKDQAAIHFAARCVGRWPSGASLVNFPEKDPQPLSLPLPPPDDNPANDAFDNDDFGYADADPDGLKCPFGSHLRRNNPRDAFRWYDKKQSLKISRRHRIIRRGRNYITTDKNGKEEQGLHFICFNANIELQFEFIQSAWANNNQLRHMNNDVDVIIGVPQEKDPNASRNKFTTQKLPANSFTQELERFVTIRGGEYFFFPSLSAIKYLTTL